MGKKFDAKVLWKKAKGFWNQAPQGRFLNLKEILCFGSTTLGVQFICCIVNMYVTIGELPKLYNMGDFGTLHATIIYIIANALGMIFSPIYANMVEKTHTKFGKYKPYILFVAPIVAMLGVLACWNPQNLSTVEATIWCYCTCVPLLFIWNLWFNSFNMFPSVISPNQQERTDINAPLGLIGGFAPTVINFLKDIFAAIFGDITGARVLGFTCVILGVICIIPLVKVKERVFVTNDESKKEKIGIFKALKYIWKNKPLLVLTIALCLGCLRSTIDFAWGVLSRITYAESPVQAAVVFSATGLIVGFAATPNMILLPFLTRKFNNRTILLGWQGINTLGYFILAIVGMGPINQIAGGWGATIVTVCRFMCCFHALGSLQPLVLSELTDNQQNLCGYRLQGYIQTMAYSIPLFVTQVLSLIPALIQGAIGYNPANYRIPEGATEAFRYPQEVIDTAIQYGNIAAWISAVSCALMFIALIFYTFDKKKYAKVMDELKAKSVNADEIASEMSTGIDIGESEEVATVENEDNNTVDNDSEENVDTVEQDAPTASEESEQQNEQVEETVQEVVEEEIVEEEKPQE